MELYLPKCIESILNQTYQKMEIILVDDGSTDRSADICEEYEKKDSRIKVINQNNRGLSAARNVGIDLAKGKYIFFVDADDFLLKETLAILVEEIENSCADLAVCDWIWADEDGVVLENIDDNYQEKEVMSGKQFLINSSCRNGWKNVVAWNKLYRKEIFDDLRFEEGKICEDVFLLHQVCDRCEKVIVIQEILYVHVSRLGSIMQRKFTKERLDAVEGYIKRLEYLIRSKEQSFNDSIYNTMSHMIYLTLEYARNMGFDDKTLNLLFERYRNNVLEIIPFLFRDNSRSIKERISLCVLLWKPQIYWKIWGIVQKNRY